MGTVLFRAFELIHTTTFIHLLFFYLVQIKQIII